MWEKQVPRYSTDLFAGAATIVGMKILGVLLSAALLLAPAANATSGDQQYLDTLTTYRLGCGQGAFSCPNGDSDMIQIGHAICHELLNGGTEVSIAADAMRHKAGFGREQAAELIHTAEDSYCPSAAS